MAEYILKQAALDALQSAGITRNMRVYKKVQDIQAADVEPVRHGQWEYHLMPIACKCSACGYRTSNSALRYNHMNYCPNCGAKMDGGADSD